MLLSQKARQGVIREKCGIQSSEKVAARARHHTLGPRMGHMDRQGMREDFGNTTYSTSFVIWITWLNIWSGQSLTLYETEVKSSNFLLLILWSDFLLWLSSHSLHCDNSQHRHLGIWGTSTCKKNVKNGFMLLLDVCLECSISITSGQWSFVACSIFSNFCYSDVATIGM